MIPDYVEINFGYVTSMLHYLEESELESTRMREILKEYPKYGMGFNIEIRKLAYKVLEWCVAHPETDFKQLDSWYVTDNASFYEKIRKLYDIMTEFRFYLSLEERKSNLYNTQL